MTVQEEIEQLKTKLTRVKDERQEADTILELLDKYGSINSISSKPYIDQLLQLADKFPTDYYRGWGLNHLAAFNRLTGDYNSSIDQGQQALTIFEKINDSKGVAFACNVIGNIFGYQGNYPESLRYYLWALRVREQLNDKPGIATLYSNIGIIYANQANYPESLNFFSQALKAREEINDKLGIASAYGNIGIILSHQGNYPDALKAFFHTLKIMEETGDKSGTATAYGNIAVIYHFQGNHPEALKSHLQALQLQEKIGDKRSIALSYSNIGNVYTSQGNYSEGLKNYLQALQIMQEVGSKDGTGTCYSNIGAVFERQGNYSEALKNHLRALQIKSEIGDKHGIALCYSNIGGAYEKLGKNDESLKNGLLALQLSEEIGNKELIKESSLALFNSYKAAGDFENALKYHQKYHQVESEMLGEQTQKQLTNLNFMHNMEQKEKEAEINRLRNVELKGALDHLQIEKDRSESLLLNILPSEVAEELKQKGESEAKLFEDVTVLFTDFKGFTTVSERLTPQELVSELHTCFKAFDEIIGKYNIEKIKTVGDAYLAASGVPVPNANHAGDLVHAAIEIRDFMLNRRKMLGNKTFEMRLGLHSGKVVAGIVGVKKFAYDIWGDTVNTAARMEQNGVAGKVNISEATYELVKDKFKCQYRGEIEAKNKGKLKMYFVE